MRKVNLSGETCIKCGFAIPLTDTDNYLLWMPDVDHNAVAVDPIQRLNSWQGRENCKLKGEENFNNKQDHFLLYCPRCDYVDEVLPLDYEGDL